MGASRCLFKCARSVCARQCGRSVVGPEAQASVSLLQAAGELCCSVLCCYRLTQRASRTMKERKRIPLLRLTRMLAGYCTTPCNALLLPARLQCSGGPEKENKERESWAKLNVYALRIRNRRTPAATKVWLYLRTYVRTRRRKQRHGETETSLHGIRAAAPAARAVRPGYIFSSRSQGEASGSERASVE